MAYTEKMGSAFDCSTEVDCSSTGLKKTFMFSRPAVVRQVMASVSTVMNSSGVIVVDVYQVGLGGAAYNDSSSTKIGTLKIPATAAVGSVTYLNLAAIDKFLPGQALIFYVSTAATTSGKCSFMFAYDDSPEVAGNNSKMTATA